jgi:hypothetical protein
VCLLDPHSRPIGVELIRDHHRQSCANALSHFRTMGDDRNLPGPVDCQIDVWGKGTTLCRISDAEWSERRDVNAEDQGGRTCRYLEDRSPTDILNRDHSVDSVAALMAARILK